MPSFTSEVANTSIRLATAMSQADTSPIPPAIAGPCTRASVGLERNASVRSILARARASVRFCSTE